MLYSGAEFFFYWPRLKNADQDFATTSAVQLMLLKLLKPELLIRFYIVAFFLTSL